VKLEPGRRNLAAVASAAAAILLAAALFSAPSRGRREIR
jgi:hypothetical protein